MPSAVKADPTLDQDAADLYEALQDLIRVYQFRDRDRICCHDLSVTQCYALDALVRLGPMTLNGLAGTLYLDKSTMSRVVATLQRKRLVVRAPDPEDRRSAQLRATARGTQLHTQISAEIQASEKRLIADFPPQVRRSMIDLIARLAKTAGERVSTTGGMCCCLE
jgi:DNA-binding MarR family transcriptional regulator